MSQRSGSGDKKRFQPLQMCHLISLILQSCPSTASHREYTKVVSSGPLPRLRGRNVYMLVSGDYATKWLENCPTRRQQLRFQPVNNSLEVHISEGTVLHLPLHLGVGERSEFSWGGQGMVV